MLLNMLKSKIHRATITDANLNYIGSITIDSKLLEKANILENEQVHVWDITNGSRLVTYAIPGDPGVICVNGAGAHLCKPGDFVIIASFVQLTQAEANSWKPVIINVDKDNK